jgi:hypothetical protein
MSLLLAYLLPEPLPASAADDLSGAPALPDFMPAGLSDAPAPEAELEDLLDFAPPELEPDDASELLSDLAIGFDERRFSDLADDLRSAAMDAF